MAADGTLAGLVAEVEELVESERERFSSASTAPAGASHFVLSRLQRELEVGSLPEVLQRTRALVASLRSSVALLNSLRATLFLPHSATAEDCLAAVARAVQRAH